MKITIVMIIMLLIVVSCISHKTKKPSVISGELAALNTSGSALGLVEVLTSKGGERFGALGGGKVIGFMSLELDKTVKVTWVEKDDFSKPFFVEFDLTDLDKYLNQTNSLKFVYLGDKKWKLKAYHKISWDNETLLKEIDSSVCKDGKFSNE